MADFIEAVAQATGLSGYAVVGFMGLIVGAFLVGIVGKIARTRGVWRGQAAARDRPQTAFTTKTPRQVMETGRIAGRNLTCSTVLIFLFFVVALGAIALWRLDRLDEIVTWAGRSLDGWLTP